MITPGKVSLSTRKLKLDTSNASVGADANLKDALKYRLNNEQHGAKSAMAEPISGHSAPKSVLVMAISAIPVAPPMLLASDLSLGSHLLGVACLVGVTGRRAQPQLAAD